MTQFYHQGVGGVKNPPFFINIVLGKISNFSVWSAVEDPHGTKADYAKTGISSLKTGPATNHISVLKFFKRAKGVTIIL